MKNSGLKTFIFFISLILALALSTKSYSQDNDETDFTPKTQFIIFYDLGYSGDKGIEDYTRKGAGDISDAYNSYGSPYSSDYHAGSTEDSKISQGVGLEFRTFFGNIGYGIGLGIHSKSTSTTVESSDNEPIEVRAKLFIIDLAPSIFYRFFLSDNVFISTGLGIDIFYGIADISDSGVSIPYSTEESYFVTAQSSGLGCHIKTDITFLYKSIGITMGVGARYIESDEFYESFSTTKLDLKAGITGVHSYIGITSYI